MPDVDFFWDPVCPWAWITSRWVEEVASQRALDVDWRFISLRIVNEHRDYGTEFPAGYPEAHGRGLNLLRMAAAARREVGREALGPLYTVLGRTIHVEKRPRDLDDPEVRVSLLEEVGLPASLADAFGDEVHDGDVRADTECALERAGRDVGTPVVTFSPPDGPSFFGPVISRVPRGPEALELWEATERIAHFPGFAELKRSIRERPQVDS